MICLIYKDDQVTTCTILGSKLIETSVQHYALHLNKKEVQKK